MREAEILRKQAQMAKLEESRQRAERQVKEISHDIERLERSRRRQKMLCAGAIVGKAELLESFNPDELYAVLMENRERILGMGDEEVPYA